MTSPCLNIVTSLEEAEELSSRLVELGAWAIEQRDHTTMLAAEKGTALLVVGFEDEATRARAYRALLETGESDIEVSVVDVPSGSWETAWRAFFKPVVLSRLLVVTPWMKVHRGDLIPIVIDPGRAFGTGGHATTRMILRLLEKRAAAGGLPERILDVGCGSGILSVGAVKLGAGDVLAVDIDEDSVVCTVDNAKANGVADAVRARRGTAADLQGEWPLVMANLQLSVFLSFAAQLADRVAVGGELLLSGLLAEQRDECLSLWPGFALKETVAEEDWIALALERLS